jgi:Molybdopterin oxidoreductase
LVICIKLFLHVLELKFFNFINCTYGLFADLQLAFSLKNFFNSIGCSNISQLNISQYNMDFRFLFLLNTSLEYIEEVDFVILVCTNLRLEAPLLASRLRKNCIINNFSLKIYSFGLAISNYFLTVKNVGNSIKSLILFLEGKVRFMINFFFNDFYNLIFLNYLFLNFEKPIVFLGSGNAFRFDFISIVNAFWNLSFRFFG